MSVHNKLEAKNLLRQNFIESDVGKPKAAVLANRYSRAYGVNVIPVLEMVGTDQNMFRTLDAPPQNPGSNCLVIMCVDSAQARRDIITAWSHNRLSRVSSDNSQQPFFIDAGNEDNFGQVRFFHRVVGYTTRSSRVPEIPKLTPARVQTDVLPMDVDYYVNLQDNPGGSCAELDQTLAINALMATLIMGVVQNLYYVKPFNYHCLSISLNGAVSSSPFTPAYMKSVTKTISGAGDIQRLPISGGGLSYVCSDDIIIDYVEQTVEALEAMGLSAAGTPLVKLEPLGDSLEFRVGDVVRIERAVYGLDQRGHEPRDVTYDNTWTTYLTRAIGTECTVARVDASGVRVRIMDIGLCTLSPYSLRLVSRPEPAANAEPDADFRVGDQVVIERAVYGEGQEEMNPHDPSYGATWADRMDGTIGEPGVIERVMDDMIRVRITDVDDYWSYSPLSLRLVSRAAETAPQAVPATVSTTRQATLPAGMTEAPALVSMRPVRR